MSVYGAVLGIAVGLAFGLTVVAALPETFVSTVAVPWIELAVIVVVSGVLGVVAALFPASAHHPRLDVLRAITLE